MQLRFVDDELLQRQHNIAVIKGAIARALQTVRDGASGGAHAHRERVVFLLCAAQFRGGASDPRLALIE